MSIVGRCRLDEVPRLVGAEHERLLAQDVRAGFQRRPCLLVVARRTAGDDDEVGTGIDDLVPVGRRALETEPLLALAEHRRVATVDDERLDLVGMGGEGGQVLGHRPSSGPDDAESQPGHGSWSSGGPGQRRSVWREGCGAPRIPAIEPDTTTTPKAPMTLMARRPLVYSTDPPSQEPDRP